MIKRAFIVLLLLGCACEGHHWHHGSNGGERGWENQQPNQSQRDEQREQDLDATRKTKKHGNDND
jgi:hypothetical protein